MKNDIEENDIKEIDIKEILNLWEKNIDNNNYNTLFVDIPFCIQKCNFCIHNKYLFKNEDEVDNYLELLKNEMKFYSDIFKSKYISSLYVGGGSPSILNENQINILKDLITTYYNINIEENGQRTIELNPADLTPNKIEALFNNPLYNRVSIGIQNFSKDILSKNHRKYTSPQQLKNIIDLIKYYNKDINVNIDLMVGIGETKEEFVESFNLLNNIDLNLITVYVNTAIKRDEKLIKDFDFIMKNINKNRYMIHWLDNDKDVEVKACYLFFNKSNIKEYDYIYSLGPSISNRIGFGPLAESQINNINFFYYRDKSLNFFDSKFYYHYKTEPEFVIKDFNKFKLNNKWIF